MATKWDKEWLPERNFVGYGLDTPKNCWPNGKKIVVNFALNYEEGAEQTPWNGDKTACDFLFEDHYDRVLAPPGKRDLVVENQFEYGIRAGLPRLIRLFDKFGWKFTMWACARAFETSGDYPRILAERGHEVACHGNRWRNHGTNGEEQAFHINKSFDRLQKSTGLKNVPTAWFVGGGGTQAQKYVRARIHKDRGVPLLYCSDTYACDLPYWIGSPLVMDGEEDEGMLMIPYSLTNNDHRFMVASGAGTGTPNDWFELLKADFDYLYQEGLEGRPKMMTVAMHNRMLGKPARAMALKRFMEYIASKEDVWVATREEIAAHWRKEYPYEKVGTLASKYK